MYYDLNELSIASIYLLRGFVSGKYKSIEKTSNIICALIEDFKENDFYEDRIYITFFAISMLTESIFKTEFESILAEKQYTNEKILELNNYSKIVAHALENC